MLRHTADHFNSLPVSSSFRLFDANVNKEEEIPLKQ